MSKVTKEVEQILSLHRMDLVAWVSVFTNLYETKFKVQRIVLQFSTSRMLVQFNMLDHLRLSLLWVRKIPTQISVAIFLAAIVEDVLEHLLDSLHLHLTDALQSEGASKNRPMVAVSHLHWRHRRLFFYWRIFLLGCWSSNVSGCTIFFV